MLNCLLLVWFAVNLQVCAGLGFWSASDPTSSAGASPTCPLALCIEPPPAPNLHISKPPKKIIFEGREYETSAALPILMDAARNGPSERREAALRQLRQVHWGLRGTPVVPELIALYDALPGQRKAQHMILQCLFTSQDPRSIELFWRVKSATDSLVRFWAAIGLASANEQSGVQLLLTLLDDEAKQENDKTIADMAIDVLRSLNTERKWGCPDESFIRELGQSTPGIGDLELARLYKEKWRSWFATDKSRFPTWNPGDALPSIECPRGENP